MSELAHHAALVLSAAALGAAGLRAASTLVASGLERVLAAVVLALAAACLEAMALGLVDLGGSTLALALAALGTWVVARALLPAPEVRAADELLAWWRSSALAVRVAVAAVAGAGLVWSAWLVRHPALGLDSVQYHLTEAVMWVERGDPGAGLGGLLEQRTSIPLVGEVLLAWQLGLSRSLVPASLLAPQTLLLLASSAWVGLRSLGTSTALRVVAVAALCATPMLTHWQYNGAHVDLPALAFLVSCAALVAAARRTPALLAPALVAGALAAGTKTTALPLTVVVLGIGLWTNRASLAGLRRPLLLAAAPALVIGGFWYLRDLMEHGSPFWPDLALPGGDAASRSGPAFLERPRATVREFGDDYLEVFGGGLLMLGGALIAPLVARRREVLWAAAVTAGSVLLWMSAPTTGAAADGTTFGTLSTLRYTLPSLSAAIVTLVLAARASPAGRALAFGVLGAALAVNVVETADLGYPQVPGIGVLVAGAAAGALAGLALSALSARSAASPSVGRPAGWAAVGFALLAAAVLLAAGAPGYVERHARAYAATPYPEAPMIGWLARQPEFEDGDAPVAMSPVPNAPVVGDRLQHSLILIALDEPCAGVRAHASKGWVLLNYLQLSNAFSAARCLDDRRPAVQGSTFRAFRPPATASARASY